MRDFESYYAGGATWTAGEDPYSRAVWQAERTIPGVVATRDELLPFLGPPAYLPLWALLARFPYTIALRVWAAVLIAALLVIVIGALALADAPRNTRTVGAAFVLAIASGPVISDIALGQVAIVAAAAVIIALLALRARNVLAATGAIFVAAIQPNLAFVLIGRLRDRRALIAAAAAFVVFLIACLTIAGGSHGAIGYLQMLAAHTQAERFTVIQHTLPAIGYGFGLPHSIASPLGLAVSLIVAIATIVCIRQFQLDPIESTALACVALPLVIPFFHEHDFVIELFVALVLAVRASGIALPFAAVGTVLVATDWLALAQRANGQWQTIAFVVSVALAFVALSGRTRHRLTFVPAVAMAALVLVLAPFAQAHIAPTWPDFLSEQWRAPAAWSVGTVWHAEQVASGLESRDWVWSVLRCLPLAGCLLLGTAIVLETHQRRAVA